MQNPQWERAGRPARHAAPGSAAAGSGTWLILADGSALGPTLADRLSELGEKILMFPGAAVNPANPTPFQSVLAEAGSTGSTFKGIVYIAPQGEGQLDHVAHAITGLDAPPPRLWVVTRHIGDAPAVTYVTLDLPGADTTELAAMLLADEFLAGEPHRAVAYRPDGRYVLRNSLQS